MGFGVPLADWLRGPLRPWAEELLSRDALARRGPARPGPGSAGVEAAHQAADLGYELWDVLMLQAWLERWSAAGTSRPRRSERWRLSPAVGAGPRGPPRGARHLRNAASPICLSRLLRSVGPLPGSPRAQEVRAAGRVHVGLDGLRHWDGLLVGRVVVGLDVPVAHQLGRRPRRSRARLLAAKGIGAPGLEALCPHRHDPSPSSIVITRATVTSCPAMRILVNGQTDLDAGRRSREDAAHQLQGSRPPGPPPRPCLRPRWRLRGGMAGTSRTMTRIRHHPSPARASAPFVARRRRSAAAGPPTGTRSHLRLPLLGPPVRRRRRVVVRPARCLSPLSAAPRTRLPRVALRRAQAHVDATVSVSQHTLGSLGREADLNTAVTLRSP